MADAEDWSKLLQDHPIFTPSYKNKQNLLELSALSLSDSKHVDSSDAGSSTLGRRQIMILRDADLIVADKEIRMTSFGDLKLSRSTRKSYKTLHTPNLQFEIRQISLNPSGKLLAVAGTHQAAVVVLPRAGYNRLIPETIDCKCVQIGQFYHAANNSPAIAKIDWHPWGEAGSTLLIMTVDGKLREYDISADTEEPQQVLSFVPEKKAKAFMAEDDSEREVASFTLGKGRADWGPLTVYAVTRSGDIYSICPYMPQNASIPSNYVHSLECFISAKQEYLTQEVSAASKNLSAVYDYQRKYVTALIKQLPPGTVFPAASRFVLVHPPSTIKPQPLRQGPFLLQPAPRMIEGSFGGDATDIMYLAFGTDGDGDGLEDDGRDAERLGLVLVAYQDGKVDVFLDVEKIEARWNIKQSSGPDLPMLAVYETIDFGLVSTLKDLLTVPPYPTPLLDLLHSNHPTFLLDPLHDDTVYVYHAFGVHALDVGPVLQSLTSALRTDDEDESVLKAGLEKSVMTNVQPILNTFSVERRASSPVVAVAIPNDVYLTYSMFILTSTMRMASVPLNLRSEPLHSESKASRHEDTDLAVKSKWFSCPDGPSSHISMLGTEPFIPPSLTGRFSDLSTSPKLLLPQFPSGSKELTLTPDTLRFLGNSVAQITSQSREVIVACQVMSRRMYLQQYELPRLTQKCQEIESLLEKIKGPGRNAIEVRLAKVQGEQKVLLARLDRMLQGLMEKASPELSEHEAKWFEELKRMKEDVLGRGRYDEDSLVCRTQLLEKEHARLLPALQKLVEKEKQQGKKISEVNQNLGFSQAFEYGKQSNLDRTRIAALEKQVTKLANRVDIPLARSSSSP